MVVPVTAAHGQLPRVGRADAEAPISVEDARTGFYMIRTSALAGARASLSGAHLADALGAVVALAHVCHRQGYDAVEQRAEVTLDLLVAEHLRVSRERVVRILDHLQRSGVIERNSARFDGARRRPTEIRFTGEAIPFARVDAPAYGAIADAAGRALLRHLALYVTLVDLAGEQRDQHDGSRRIAVATYGELERRSGVSLRRVKDLIASLISCGVLDREAQRSDNGMKIANRYRLIDVVPSHSNGGATAERWKGHARTTVVPGSNDGGAHAEPSMGESRTVDGHRPNDGRAKGPSHARASDIQTEQNAQNQIPTASRELRMGEGEESSDIDAVCGRFVSSLEDALGPRRTARMVAGHEQQWRDVAAGLLRDFDLARLLSAIDYLRTDTILSGRARTLPEFAALADEAVLRSQAASRRDRPAAAQGRPQPSWAAAWGHLRRAVSAFGRAGKQGARESLAAKDPALTRFVDEVGWGAICQADPDDPTDLKFAWLAFMRQLDEEEAA